MPSTRPCSHIPGDRGDPNRCPRLTTHRSGLCDHHLQLQRAHVDANRPNAYRRGYDTAHRADRPAAGTSCVHPSCAITTSLHRDHIDGNPANNDPANIQWLCATHHGRKTLTHDVQRDEHGRILPKGTSNTRQSSGRARAVDL